MDEVAFAGELCERRVGILERTERKGFGREIRVDSVVCLAGTASVFRAL